MSFRDIKTARIETYSTGLFQFSETGVPVEYLPVFDEGHMTIDHVAWRPEMPAKWVRKRGAADLLGCPIVAMAGWRNEPVTLYATPSDWAEAPISTYPVCILDPRRDPRFLFGFVPKVIFATPELERQFELSVALHARPAFETEVAP